jgi:DNA repair exonuclease SbcCD ATPase subunit
LEQQVESLGRSKEEFADTKQQAVEGTEQAFADVKEQEGKANEALHKLAGKVQDVKSMVTELELVTELKAKLDNMDLDLRDMKTEKSGLEERLGDVEAKVLELIGAGRCPECRVQLRGEALTEMKQAFAPDLKDVQAKLAALDRRMNPKMQERGHAVQRYKDTEKRLRIKYQLESLEQVEELKQQFSKSVLERQQKLHESLLERVREARSALEREKDRKWEGEAPLEQARKALADAEYDQEVLKAERLLVNDALAMAEYWVEGFGNRGIRSLMFDSVADFLNRRITDHLEVLTGGEATVKFSALSALKKGGMKEKISIESSWSWGAKGSSGASAGQGRRIDLAIFGALQDLAEQRSARPFPVRIWDEAGDSLDARGKEIFAEWARVEARRRGTGFVITHDREFGEILEPDYVWTVVMNKDGSSEVVVE